MAFFFENLDSTTRELMLKEVEEDITKSSLFLSDRLSGLGRTNYPQLLKNAILEGNELTLSNSLSRQFFNDTETRNTKNGLQIVKVSATANATLAEGEFNRFYIRALCRRVISEKKGNLEIYRAKPVANPRMESESMIGQIVDPQKILSDLISSIGVETALGVPAGPNSGLSVRIVNDKV